MSRIHRLALALSATCMILAGFAAPSMAVVGGTDVPAGQHRNVAEIVLGKAFGCSGTLIAPQWVMTAGHCGSLTGAAVSTPAAWPAAAIDVRLGSNRAGQGTLYPAQQVVVEPDYLLTEGYDISLIKLQAPVAGIAPTQVANGAERAIWNPGELETIVGWGVTSENGSAPDTLQQAEVPITTDAYCAKAYSSFDPATMVCAGYPQGGTDTCQGDSGGPMFAYTPAGEERLVGATSFGNGCAQAGYPGAYARVADAALRTWIGSVAPDAVAPAG